MSENYAGSEFKKYTTMLRDILKELPPFCQEFFRGIQNDTMVRTRYAYAFDLRIFFRFLVMQPEFSDKAVTSLTFGDLDRVTTSTIEEFQIELTDTISTLDELAELPFDFDDEDGEEYSFDPTNVAPLDIDPQLMAEWEKKLRIYEIEEAQQQVRSLHGSRRKRERD